MTIDLNFMATTTDPAQVPLIFDNTVNTGSFKLAQRVIVLLFKDKESALLPSLGTSILHVVGSNVMQDNDLRNQFKIAGDRVRDYIQSNTAVGTPEDEQLADLQITAKVDPTNRGKVLVNMTVETVSGEAINSTVPYSLHGE